MRLKQPKSPSPVFYHAKSHPVIATQEKPTSHVVCNAKIDTLEQELSTLKHENVTLKQIVKKLAEKHKHVVELNSCRLEDFFTKSKTYLDKCQNEVKDIENLIIGKINDEKDNYQRVINEMSDKFDKFFTEY